MLMSHEQILHFVETSLPRLTARKPKRYGRGTATGTTGSGTDSGASTENSKDKGTGSYVYEDSPLQPLTCVQMAGDIILVPESWGHGVLNLQVSGV